MQTFINKEAQEIFEEILQDASALNEEFLTHYENLKMAHIWMDEWQLKYWAVRMALLGCQNPGEIELSFSDNTDQPKSISLKIDCEYGS